MNDNINALPDIGPEISQDSCDYITPEEVQSLNCSENDLMILQLNIPGLISKQSSISHLINNCAKNHKILDVVLLCETWVTKNTKDLIHIPGYDFVGIE